MAQYISADYLKQVVERLRTCKAQPALTNYLILKRATQLDPDGTVKLSMKDEALRQAISELMACDEPVNLHRPAPLVNVIGTEGHTDNGYRSGRYYSNGTSDAISSGNWASVRDISGKRPRVAMLKFATPEELQSLLLISNPGNQKPRLDDVAAWMFRHEDVSALTSEKQLNAQAMKKLEEELTLRFGLTKDDLTLFQPSSSADQSLPTDWRTDTMADPDDYLPQAQSNQVPADVDASQIPALVQARLLADGLIFEPSFVEAFLLALKTKPFVILSGISGTGKSALPRALAHMVGNDIQPIAIAPDWTDNSDMLGYFDMNGHFVSGEFTSLVAQAALAPDAPFFVVLDEMNLARVEYYFAQVLSVLESRRRDPQSGMVSSTDYLFNPAMRDRLASENNAPEVQALASLRFGPNVYLIGTVNIDETTHPFSKKVLDRANVLEVNDVDLMQGLQAPADDGAPAPSDVPNSNAFFAGNITRMSELQEHWATNAALDIAATPTLTTWVAMLERFAAELRPHNLHFGFRVRDEVCIYLYHAARLDPAATADEAWWHRFFDSQLVQKVLTRLAGEQDQIEPTLVALFNLCASETADYDANDIVALSETQLTAGAADDIAPRFRLAARKLRRMLHEIIVEGRPATSFWTA